MSTASQIAGVVLAGGLSRRMGGQEKSLMTLGGKEPIAWVTERLALQVSTLAINANGDASRFEFLSLPVLADTVDGFVGPLAGVLAGMRWANTLPGITHLATAAADTPFFPENLIARLQEAVENKDDVVMASSNGRIHPVFALWPVHLADQLEHFLVTEDKRKILEFAMRTHLSEVVFNFEDNDPFFNINTPEDLARAEIIANQVSASK